jgi:integrase
MPSFDFTDRGLRALKPMAQRREYWDASVPGPGLFGLRVTPAGVKTWIVFYRIRGRNRRHSIGRFPLLGYADARLKGREALANAQLGEDPAEQKQATRERDRETVKALFNAYSESVELRRKEGEFRSWPHVRRSFERDILPVWGPRPAQDIRRKDVRELVTRKALTGRTAANRLQSHVSMLFAFGVENDWVAGNPVAGLKKRQEKPRDRFLSSDELRKLWQYLDAEAPIDLSRGTRERVSMAPGTAQTLRDLFKVLLLTGQRLGETSRMAWADVDLDARVWLIPATETKNATAHRVPLARSVLAILSARDEAAAPSARFVFGSSASGEASVLVWSKRAAKAIATAVGFTFTAHDLRRTLATGLGDLGISDDVIGLVLNHKKQGVTGRHYDKSTREAPKRDALEQWAEHVDGLVTGKKAKVVRMRRRKGRAA